MGYGDPHFLFAYFLPYLIPSFFHFIGFSFLISMKLLLAISFLFSGITMFFWVKDELGEKSGFVSAIFYLFMPYHLLDMHFRVTIAENLSFAFLPLILLAIKKNIEYNSKKWFIILSISFTLLILSHQAISVMFLPIMILYSIFIWLRIKNRMIKKIAYCFLSIFFGLLISSFYWLPIVFLAKFTQQGLSPASIAFPNFTELLYSPWRFGFLFQGHKGELSYLIGYTQLLIVLLSIYLVLKGKFNKKLKKILLFFLAIAVAIFVLILPISKVIWAITPLLKYSQYSTRLLVPLALCISVIAGIVTKKINKTWFITLLCFLTVIYTLLNWGNRRTIPGINDNYLKQEFNLRPNGGLEPTSPIWAKLNTFEFNKKTRTNIEVLEGKAIIKESLRTPILHSYRIYAKSNIEIKENTLYFPGWIVTANERGGVINYKSSKFPGVITFKLNKGTYNVDVKFTDLPIITFSKWLSGLSFFGILIYIFIPKKLKFPKL